MALFATPQNNFHIFLNGSLIYGGLGGAMVNGAIQSHERNEKIEDLIKFSGLQLDSFLVLVAEKTVVSVDMLCSKCKKKVMKLVAGIEGINSIVLDSSKGLATIVGEADPAQIIRKMRKFRKSAEFVSIGPAKEEKKEEKKDEKKDVVPYLPSTCQNCSVWYVIGEDYHNYCSIL